MLDYRNFWTNERWKPYHKPYEKYSKHHCLFRIQSLFQNGANDISEMVYIIRQVFVKKIKILCSKDHSILFKFCQLVVNIDSKELQILFWAYIVSNSNGNVRELERKNSCKKFMFHWVFLVTVRNADIGSLKFHL